MPNLHSLQRGKRRYSLNDSTCTNSSVIVNDWVQRVINNGGGRPSDNTISSLITFYDTLSNNNLDSKILGANCFVPDNFTASLTPLINVSGSDPWINTGFVASDLTIDGLKSNGSKYLNTGLNPTIIFPDSSSAGMSIYNVTDGAANVNDMGIFSAGGNQFAFYVDYGDTFSYFDCWSNAAGARAAGIVSTSSFAGFTSGNRINYNTSSIYRVNGISPITMIANATTVGDISTRPNAVIFCFSQNNPPNTPTGTTSRRYSFSAVHFGLTLSEVSVLFGAVQTLRISFGGGYL